MHRIIYSSNLSHNVMNMKKGNKYGTHRVIEPKGVLPQTAYKISNDMELFDNEILIAVDSLNIDSAIVDERGKMQNPVTGSGGMLMGTVEKIGEKLNGKINLHIGDRIATLVSLSLTPLKIEKIQDIKMDIDRVDVKAQAILFESGIYSKLPEDMDESLALAALDVAGAPAQVAKLVKPGDCVFILGATGKSGILCAYEARKRVGPTGKVIGLARNKVRSEYLKQIGYCHDVVIADAKDATSIFDQILAINNGNEVDISINCLNIPECEMSSILPVRNGGIVYFFSMATSFTRAALGAEGIGKDVLMIIGNGYTKDHAEITLEELRESKKLRDLFEKKYINA
jgi:L-erythro-3,5-diaminohexanoate dehydrogenase